MRRFSIRSLMAFVLAVALAITALRNANDVWAGGMLLATPLLLGVALIGGICGAERSRVRRLGFAILGGAYFALVFLGSPDRYVDRLPTSQLLDYIHRQVAPTVAGTFTTTAVVAPGVGNGASSVSTANSSAVYVVSSKGILRTGRWAAILPGASNDEAFTIVGHCLFVMLAGLIGGAVAVWFDARRERAAPDVSIHT